MRPRAIHTLCGAILLAGSIAACQQAPVVAPRPTEPVVPTTTQERQTGFSSDRAWADLRALTEIGPRVIDTDGNAKARQYIEDQLAKSNIEFEVDEHDMMARPEAEPGDDEATEAAAPSLFVHNVMATIPGRLSSGSILLVAPYDTEAFEDFDFVGANDGGSGAAVLLELGRAIAASPLPYTTRLAFIDGHASHTLPDAKGTRRKGAGLVRLAVALRDEGAADAHLVVYLNRICDADLRIARDLLSHRIYREEFFDAARRLGRTDAFPPDAPFESTGLKHQALRTIGLRRIVTIVDMSFGGDEPPGLYAGTEQDTIDHCSAESLDTVGKVVLAGLETVSRRLEKIDRFTTPNESTSATSDEQGQTTAADGAGVQP